MLKYFFRDKNKKKWLQILKEFTTLYISKKKIPLYYISNLLYRNNVFNYKDYLSLEESNKVLSWSFSHGKEQIVLAENKLLFEELLVKNNISTPKIFFHNSKSKFTLKDNIYEIETKKDFYTFLDTFFNKIDVDRIFCKPIRGSMGRGIFVLDKNTFRDLEESLINLVLSEEFIFQETIVQHESLKKIYPFCINSLRIISYKNKDNIVELLTGVQRVGLNDAVLDNSSEGGLIVRFNMENGKMKGEALQFLEYGGGAFNKHPQTGIVFENYQIPYYSQVKEIVIKAASLFKFPLLGWDIGVTPNGPVIIEVNHNFHLLSSDKMEKGLKNNPSFKKILNEIK